MLASQPLPVWLLKSPGVPVAPPTWSHPRCSSLPAAGAAAPVTAGAAAGAEDAEAASESERRGRAPRPRERARARLRVLMLMLLPGTGRTAHALLWKRKERGKKREQSDAASEVTVAPQELGAGERGSWQPGISQRGRKKSVGISRTE